MVNLLNKKMKNLLILFCLLSAGFTAFSQTLSSKEFRPQVGFGAGYFSFYGEVSNKKANSPLVGQMGFYFDVSRKINSYFDLGFTYINGTVTGNQNSGAFINFQTRINSFSAYGLYNWGHFLHNKVIQPYTSIGFETFEFNSKADLVNSAGNPYFHWDDGSIKNIAQTAPNAADAIELKRDYDYESDLRGLNLDGLGNYARVSFSVPVGFGLQFNISDRFTLRMGSSFHYTFTDNVDNVSQAGKGLRQGNASNDYFFYNSASLHYDLLGGAARAKKDFQFVDYFAINTTDTDNDGVFDWYDRCSATPKGVAVDSSGCPLDSDHDGVADYLDKEASAAKAFVNASGVEMTDADYEKWYRRYIDSLDIPYEILVKLADANRSGSSIYRVLVGEYSKKIPDNLADKFLAQPDIIAAPMNDTVIGYLVGKFADIELAKARQKQLLDDKFPMAKIVMQKGNTFIPIEDFDKAAELEKQEQEKGKLKDKEGQYAIQLGSTPASANAEDKAKFITADKDVKAVSGEKNSTQFIVGKYKDLTSASVDLPNFKKEFKDAKVVKIQDGKVIDDKDSTFYKAPVIKQPTDLELMEGKYAVKTTKITPVTTAAEQQKIDKALPRNLKVDNSDGTKDVLSDNTGFESVEAAKREAALLKQKGFKTEVVKVQEGKLTATDVAPPAKEKPVLTTPVLTTPSVLPKKLNEGEYAIKIGRIDSTTSPADKAKLNAVVGAIKVKNDDGSVDVAVGSFADLSAATEKLNEQKTKGFKQSELLKVQDGKLVKASGTKEPAIVSSPIDSVKNKDLIDKFTVKVGEFEKGVSNKDMDKILTIPDVKGTETFDPNKTTYTAGNYVSLDSAKARAKKLSDQGFNTEVAKYDGKQFKQIPNTKVAAKQEVVKDGKVVYRVQLGAFKNKVNEAAFKGVQVVRFDGQDSLVRYAVGSLANYTQVQDLKLMMRDKGFADAFVTAYKDGARVSVADLVGAEEFKKAPIDTAQKQKVSKSQEPEKELNQEKKAVETPVQSSIAPKDSTNLKFLKIQVQVGLFAAEPPVEIQKILETITDLKIETTEQGLKRYLTGEFENPAEASAYKESLKAKGLQDSFLIAFYKGVKINMTTAIQYYEKMK
jgi:hypothetical protein